MSAKVLCTVAEEHVDSSKDILSEIHIQELVHVHVHIRHLHEQNVLQTHKRYIGILG